VITRGSTYDNRANLAPAFLQQIVRKYEGTRLGRQESSTRDIGRRTRCPLVPRADRGDALLIRAAMAGRLRRAARIALYGAIGFIIGSIVVNDRGARRLCFWEKSWCASVREVVQRALR
jgi:hypothetical protein